MDKQFYLSLLILCVAFWHGIVASSNENVKKEEGESPSSPRSHHGRVIRHPENPPPRAHPYLRPNLDPSRQTHPDPNPSPNLHKLEMAAPAIAAVVADESKLRIAYAINPLIVVTFAEFLQEYRSLVVYSSLLFGPDGHPHKVINVRINEKYTKNNKLYDVAVLEVEEPITLKHTEPGIFESNVKFSPEAIEFVRIMAKQLLETRLGPEVPPHSH